jgi:hypothetical protein
LIATAICLSDIDIGTKRSLEFLHMRPALLMVAILCLGSIHAQAQSAAPADHSSNPKSSDSAKPELQDVKPEPHSGANPLTLKSVGPSSPEETARITAKSLADEKSKESSGQSVDKRDQGKGQAADQNKPDDAVVEFHAAGSGSGDSGTAPAVIRDQASKSALKHVHGDLYGSRSGIGHADGGSAGATSKSGKTSIYVESDQMRSTVPPPQ